MPGPQELLVIVFVALLVFGPDRLPELARNAAKLVGRFRTEVSTSVSDLKRAAEAEGLDREWREVSSELRGTRDQLRETRNDLRRSFTDGGLPTGRTPTYRADDRPPPVDSEAT